MEFWEKMSVEGCLMYFAIVHGLRGILGYDGLDNYDNMTFLKDASYSLQVINLISSNSLINLGLHLSRVFNYALNFKDLLCNKENNVNSNTSLLVQFTPNLY